MLTPPARAKRLLLGRCHGMARHRRRLRSRHHPQPNGADEREHRRAGENGRPEAGSCRRRRRLADERRRRADDEPRRRDVGHTQGAILLQAPLEQGADCRRNVTRKRIPVRVETHDGPQHVGDAVAWEGPPSGQHLVEHGAERPDVAAPIDGIAPRLFRRHVGRRAENYAAHRLGRGGNRRRVAGNARPAPSASGTTFARPKSSTLTVPSGRILMLAGFRSRWTMPASCAASRASTICLAMARASATDGRPRAMHLRQVLASHQFHDEIVGGPVGARVVDLRDVRMIERRQRPCLAFEAGSPRGVRRQAVGQDLDRNVAVQLRVAGAIDLAHATCTQVGHDLVGMEASPNRDRHRAPIVSIRSGRRNRCPGRCAMVWRLATLVRIEGKEHNKPQGCLRCRLPPEGDDK